METKIVELEFPQTIYTERKSALVGFGLAEQGHKAGTWDNAFVAKLAFDCIELESRLLATEQELTALGEYYGESPLE